MKIYAHIVLYISFLLLVFACKKPVSLPPEPKIEFKSFVINEDNSANVTILFQDGDGNVGLNDDDSLDPYHAGDSVGNEFITNIYHQNLYLDYQEKVNGVWFEPELIIPFYFRVPWIEPSGQNKTQDGEMSVNINPYYLNTNQSDSFRFKIQIADRDLNLSNEVFSTIQLKP